MGRSSRQALLSEGAARSLERLGLRLTGLPLLAGGSLFVLALATYRAQDPSWNTATNAPTGNALGYPGAVVADLLLQSLGLASVVPALCLLIWGLRLLAGQSLPMLWLRMLVAPLAALLLAAGLAVLPAAWFWPLTARPGGLVGSLTLDQTHALARLLGLAGDWRPAVAVPAMVLGFFLLLYALGTVLAELRAAARLALSSARVALAAGLFLLRALQRPNRPEPERPPRHMPAFDSDDERDSPSEPAAGAEEPEPEKRGPARRDLPRDLVAPRPRSAPTKREMQARQGSLAFEPPPGEATESYVPPRLELLELPQDALRVQRVNEEALTQNARVLETVLQDFGVHGRVVKVRPGPVVTLYELEPAPGTKTSRVIGLADDIARSMSALAVRIAVVPGQSVIGIELPNARRETVYLRELLASDAADSAPGRLMLALGKDIGGGPVAVDLARMPHVLIAGTTGSGKSVAVNTMILSLLYRLSPAECRMIMIDPKMLELSVYDGIPHLLSPVVTEPGKAVVALKWAVKEMENRYRAMSQLGVRNIAGYNQRIADALATGQTLNRTVQTGFDPETGKPIYEEQAFTLEPLPFIVVLVDEMADLMMVAGKDVEAAIQRLAQMARAAGIHLIMATQRPSVDVITGTIKANFPTRISFQVTSKIDSRTILGEQGAEQLLGQGDMLYMAAGGRITRVHGPFVSDAEVEAVVTHLRTLGEPSYIEAITEEDEDPATFTDVGGGKEGDDLYRQAVGVVLRERKISTSFIQRQLQIGYNRAAKIVERMEAEGIVGRPNHVGKREILAPE